ncbi:MAG: hypothetical protein JXR41_05895 [Bacteroidales bacterium]|nr:hypothetical protein [Bacteroidales bacterium]MBN2762602.1 hypothetical protein [Bacteroidales bacterium]
MAFNFLFKTPKPRQFHYEPLFYDARKEAREERIKKIMREMKISEGEAYKPGITRGSFRDYYKGRKRSDRFSTLRLLIIIIALVLLAYFLIMR